MGGTTGPPWDRHFECKITLDDPSPELRPGMNANVVITTEVLQNVLWVPAQALFESDGRTFVYVQSGSGFRAADVKLVRRSESQVVHHRRDGRPGGRAGQSRSAGRKRAGGGGALKAIPNERQP